LPFRSTAKQHGGVTGKGFVPGRSGNRGGRPKQSGDVRDLARVHTLAAITTLAEIMRSGRSDGARVLAAQALLDRGWGKPTQAVNLGPVDSDPRPGERPVIILESAVPRPVRPAQKPPPLSLRTSAAKEPTSPLTRPPSLPVGDTEEE